MKDVRTALFALWIFYVLNSAYGDITTLYTSVYLHTAVSIHYTPTFILFGALIVEPAILMVLLTRILPDSANRWANVVVGGLLTIVNVATLFVGTPTPAYAFLTATMIVAGVAIVGSAWNWAVPAAPPVDRSPGPSSPPTSQTLDLPV